MQSLVKFFISLLFALLFNLIPGQLVLDQSDESGTPGVNELPAALCREEYRTPEDFHPHVPGKTDSPLFTTKSSCS